MEYDSEDFVVRAALSITLVESASIVRVVTDRVVVVVG